MKANRILYPLLMTAGGAAIGSVVGQKVGKKDPENSAMVGALLGAAYGARGSILLDMSRSTPTSLAGYGTAISWRRSREITEQQRKDEAACGPQPRLVPRGGSTPIQLAAYKEWLGCRNVRQEQENERRYMQELDNIQFRISTQEVESKGIPTWVLVAGAGTLLALVLR